MIFTFDHKKTKIKIGQVEEYNKKAIFSVLELNTEIIEMQSEQHRMLSLSKLKPKNEDEWWWIVNLYDSD